MDTESVTVPAAARGISVSPSRKQISEEASANYHQCDSDDLKCLRNKQKNLNPYTVRADKLGPIQGYPPATIGLVPSSSPVIDTSIIGQKMASTSLTELAYLRRLQKYHKRKRNQAEERLQIVRTSWAVRDRLIQGRQRLLGELAKAIRFENQKWFLPLFQAFHTIEAASQEHDRIDCFLPPEHDPEHSVKEPNSESFFSRLPLASRESLLQLVHKIASDPEFLLRRLSRLSNREFDAMLRLHSPYDSSILRDNGVSQSTAYKERSNQGVVDSFLDLGRHDLFSILLQIVGPDCVGASHAQGTHYWAKVCSTLLSDQKPGADKFMVAILNAWPAFTGQSHKPHSLEIWLLEVLKDGSFLLDQSDKYSFRMRAQSKEGVVPENTGVTDAFFTRSMNSLLEILKDNLHTAAIPEASLRLGQAIVDHLGGPTKRYQAALYFLCTRWLFSSYLSNLIRSPESCGLLLSYHLSSNARRRILDELALRLQKLAFDVSYTWNHSAAVDPSLLSNMQAVVSLFRPEDSEPDSHAPMHDSVIEGFESTEADSITLCPSDVLTLVHGLFPESVASLELSAMSLTGSTVHSSASSVSGLSILRNGLPHDSGLTDFVNSRTEDGHSQFTGSLEGLGSGDSLRGYFGCSFGHSEEASLVDRLRLICRDLTVTYGPGTADSHCDPFHEAWATISIPRDSFVQPIAMNRSDADLSEPKSGACHQDNELQSLPPQANKAIKSLLDHLEDTTETAKKRPRDCTDPYIHLSKTADNRLDTPATFSRAFKVAISDCQRRGHVAKVHSLHQAWIRVGNMLQSDPEGSQLTGYLDELARKTRQSISKHQSITKHHSLEADDFKIDQDSQISQIRAIAETISRLRGKMWYISSVRFTSHYEDLSKIVSALKTMGLPARATPEKSQPILRRRPTGTSLYDGYQLNTESAIMEVVAAPPGHGGPNKLNDKQVKLTSDWLQVCGVENICKGEERLHRFCHEVSRCVDYLVGDSIAEHPVLWSSELFRDLESPSRQVCNPFSNTSPISSARHRLREMYSPQQHLPPFSRPSPGRPGFSCPPSRLGSPLQEPFLETGFSMLERTAPEYSGSCSPTLTSTTSGTLWSSLTPGGQTASSMTSLPSRATSRPLSDRSSHGSLGTRWCQKSFLEELRDDVTSLILSDVGGLFREGSETDVALWGSFGGRFANRISTSTFTKGTRPEVSGPLERHFEPEDMLRRLLRTFEIQTSPFDKIKTLYQIQEAYHAIYVSEGPDSEDPLVNLEAEAAAEQSFTSARGNSHLGTETQRNASNDVSVAGFRRLFQDSSLRPTSLFRDLQYIAALVPNEILDNNEEGHAFWNATIAALSIKDNIVDAMLETADAIVKHHTQSRGHSSVASAAQAQRDSATFTSSRPSSAAAMDKVSHYTMADAAQLYLMAARGGDGVAQRELATLYLTHPEIMKRAVAPLAKAGDVFKGLTAVDVLRGGRGLDGKYDPVIMAIARHWMELAAKGGDELAKNTLKATDEIDRIP